MPRQLTPRMDSEIAVRIPPVETILPHYPTSAEKISDGIVHAVGIVSAVAAVPVLIALAVVLNGEASAVVAAVVYGISALAMLSFSALYNLVEHPRWTGLFRRLDHSGIYFKIAGTYTPFTLLAGTKGVFLMVLLWVVAVIGTSFKIAAPDRFRWANFALYLTMGWAGAILGWPLFADLPDATLTLIVAGGVVYTLGTVFYLAERLPHHTALWHLFVLVASGLFFVAVCLRILDSGVAAEIAQDFVTAG